MRNHTAAQAHIAVVQHSRLTWRDSPLGFWKHQLAFGVASFDQLAGRVRLAVAGFSCQLTQPRCVACHPTAILRREFGRLQPRVIMPLYRPQGVGGHVFAGYKPGFVLTDAALPHGLYGFERCTPRFNPTNAQPRALTQRVKTQAHMLAHHPPAVAFDQPGRFGDVLV